MRIGSRSCAGLLALFVLGCSSGQDDPIAWKYEYDEAGRPVVVEGPSGQASTAQFEADAQGRTDRVHLQSAGRQSTLEYTTLGQLARTSGAGGNVEYEYDGFGRLVAVKSDQLPPVTYAYDSSGRVASISVGKAWTLKYAYDFQGRLQRLATPVGDVVYAYRTDKNTGHSFVTRTLPNSVESEWEYNLDGAVSAIRHKQVSGNVLSEFQYEYRPDGLIRQVRRATNGGNPTTENYEYDKVGQLTSVTAATGTTRYAYNEVGDRTNCETPGSEAVTSKFDWAGRLLEHAALPCSFDSAGNVTEYASAGQKAYMTYTPAGLLESAQIGGSVIRYEYDGKSNLVSRTSGSETVQFLPDPASDCWRPLLAVDGQGKQTFYVWDGHVPVAEVSYGNTQFYLTDHLGSVSGTVSSDGRTSTAWSYDAFGTPKESAASGSAPHPGFCGLLYDPVSSVYLTRRRAYDPSLGRFLQPDPQHRVPMGSQKDLSLYVYCGSDPVNFVDINGANPASVLRYTIPPLYRAGRNSANNFLMTSPMANYGNWGGLGRQPLDVLLADRLQMQSRNGDTTPVQLPIDRSQWKDWAARYGLPLPIDSLDEACMMHDLDLYNLRTRAFFSKPDAGFGTSDYEVAQIHQALADAMRGAMSILPSGMPVEIGLSVQSRSSMGCPTICNHLVIQNHLLGGMPSVSEDLRMQDNSGSTDYSPLFELLRQQAAAVQYRSSYAPSTGSSPSIDTLPNDSGNWSNGAGPSETLVVDESNLEVAGTVNGFDDSNTKMGSTSVGFNEQAKVTDPKFDPNLASNGSPMNPTEVGGVYLGGAGATLSDLGTLRGLSVDANGRLVLIADDGAEVNLPPLRLDDVVTVFRSVYLHGESPWVTIDPDPKKPEAPEQIIRHSVATENTYVGWVLFECDRVMKCYSKGVDNITRQPISSRVSGYKSSLELRFDFYSSELSGNTWNRHWFVPASVSRSLSRDQRLALIEVPLKLLTQLELLVNGEFINAPPTVKAKAADAFSNWFTVHYDEVADEVLLQPPADSGLNQPVAIFREMRRIALISAIAELLRDQGRPMPAWMRDYKVKPCSFPKMTPVFRNELVRKIGDTTTTLSTMGGAKMSPTDDVMKTIPDSPAAEALTSEVVRAVADAAPMSAQTFSHDGKNYRAVPIPGAETRDLGPCRLTETDLAIPIHGNSMLRLVRHYNSFFKPTGIHGAPWTLDQPEFIISSRPTKRDGDTTFTKEIEYLTSPLNTWHDTFDELKLVPETGTKLGTPSKIGPFLGTTGEYKDDRIGVATRRLLLRDGSEWHFDARGTFVASEQGPILEVYRRDPAAGGRMTRIEGWYGKHQRAHIALEYDAQGKLQKAIGNDGRTVEYERDGEGRLSKVTRTVAGKQAVREFKYRDSLLTSVWQDGKEVRSLTYDNLARLTKESFPQTRIVRSYRVEQTANGPKMVASVSQGAAAPIESSAQFDRSYRPTSRVMADGSHVETRRLPSGDSETAMTFAGDHALTVVRSADGKQASVQVPAGGKLKMELDTAGRPVSVGEDGREPLKMTWRSDGQLRSASSDAQRIGVDYHDGGVVQRLLLSTPGDGPYDDWFEAKLDDEGRLTAASDSSGSKITVGYDNEGRPNSMMTNGRSMQIQRDEKGRVNEVKTSDGLAQANQFDAEGRLQQVNLTSGGQSAVLEYHEGRPSKSKQFDGGETQYTYYPAGGPHAGRLQKIRKPNGLELNYEYDANERLSAVTCGTHYRLAYEYDSDGRLASLTKSPIAAN